LSAMAPIDLVAQAIEQALSGISNRLRAEARVEGAVSRTIEHRVALAELSKRVKGRLDGLRGTPIEEGVDAGEWPPEESDDKPVDVAPPSVSELKERLPKFGVTVDGEYVVLNVRVPESRRAHAR
jgi:hypothetical protein